MKIKKVVAEAEPMPRGYGFSYWDYDFFRAVCYPIPLNILIAWGRKAYGWLMAMYPLRIAEKPPDGYTRGYQAGLNARVNVYSGQYPRCPMCGGVVNYVDQFMHTLNTYRCAANPSCGIMFLLDKNKK